MSTQIGAYQPPRWSVTIPRFARGRRLTTPLRKWPVGKFNIWAVLLSHLEYDLQQKL